MTGGIIVLYIFSLFFLKVFSCVLLLLVISEEMIMIAYFLHNYYEFISDKRKCFRMYWFKVIVNGYEKLV